MGVSIVMGEPQNGWFKVYSQFECIMENPMKWMIYDDLGVPPFQETAIF